MGVTTSTFKRRTIVRMNNHSQVASRLCGESTPVFAGRRSFVSPIGGELGRAIFKFPQTHNVHTVFEHPAALPFILHFGLRGSLCLLLRSGFCCGTRLLLYSGCSCTVCTVFFQFPK